MRHRPTLTAAAVLLGLLLSFAAPACGGSDSGDGASGTASGDPAVDRGLALARDRGCVACHGAEGGGGVGPAWRGLAGSEVMLDDGTVVTADAGYLRRSIVEPDAQVVDGSSVKMPTVQLTDAEVDDLVAYLETL